MKILHVIPSASPIHGGPSRAIVDIESALSQRDIDVTVVSTEDEGEYVGLAHAGMIETGSPKRRRLAFRRTTKFYKVSFKLLRWLMSNVKAFDLVHVHGAFSFPSVVAAYVARANGVPYVVRPLGVLQEYGMTQRRPFLKKLSLALIERSLLEDSAAVHFTSSAEMSDCNKLGLRCNGVVIPLGIDLGKAIVRRDRVASEPFALLFLSRLDPKKNVEGLLRAFALVANEGFNLVLQIAGNGTLQYTSSLKTLANELGVSNRVEWLGHMTGDRKHNLFSSSSAFVLPSYSENFGIAVLEALAVGLPCIVSEGVAIAADIEKAGAGIVTGADSQGIAAGIRMLVSDRARCVEMSFAARRLAEDKFSLEVMGARLEAMYRKVRESYDKISLNAS